MPTLTSLPLSLQSRILRFLCEDEQQKRRSALRGTSCFLPSRKPVPNLTLDDADIADSILPNELLAPALASPVLAAAAHRLLSSATSYLTDLNTESQLPLWVKAFAAFVRAVSVRGVELQASEQLSRKLKRVLIEKSCDHAIELFRTLSLEAVRLQVLDLAHVPFHARGAMKDSLLFGLCTTLESNHTTLKQLAFPIYADSNLCARALETVTLPYLTVLSLEIREVCPPKVVTFRMVKGHSRQILRMMQAVDGHADRMRQLTTLKELRLINLAVEPCTEIRESGCSRGFFHAVRTLRVSTSDFAWKSGLSATQFLALFSKIECLHWDGAAYVWFIPFEELCTTLNEVHLCHSHWIKGAQVGVEGHQSVRRRHTRRLQESIAISNGKIRTLVSYGELFPTHLLTVAKSCPNLEHFSLYITAANVRKLRGLMTKCKRLTGLEVLIDEEEFGSLGKDGWQALGKAFPKSHPRIRDVSIQTRKKHAEMKAPIDVVTGCLVEVTRRVGRSARRLLFRAGFRTRIWSRIWNELCHILDTCTDHCWQLRYLEVDLLPSNGRRIEEDIENALAVHMRLRKSKDMVVCSLPFLNKINLGMMHRWSNEITARPCLQETR